MSKLPKIIPLTGDTGLQIAEHDSEVYVLDRDGVRLGRIHPDTIGSVRNWFSDFLGRYRVNENRKTRNAITPPSDRGRPRKHV